MDRPVLSLTPGEQILLWSMRSWVAAMAAQRCPCTALSPSFERWKLGDLLPDFNMMMLLLNREGASPRVFCRENCAHVRDDEAAILALLHAAAGRDNKVLNRLAELAVKSEAVPAFLIATVEAADVLRRLPVQRTL